MTTTPVGMRCPECAKQRTRVMTMRSAVTQPRMTFALIGLNVLAFLAEQGQFTLTGSNTHGKVVEEGLLARRLVEFNSQGFPVEVRVPIAHEHQYWRLISSGFLHENLLHIGFNMYLLYLLGMMLEPALGSVKFGVIYFTALLAGSFGALLATASPTLGASGAVFGLMGAAAVELRARRMSVMESGVGLLIVFNLAYSFAVPGISVGAHLGGLIGGALAALAIRAADERHVPWLGLAACVLISAVAVAAAIAVSGIGGSGIA